MNKDRNDFDLREINSMFTTKGDFVEGSPYGNGHINDTFAVVCEKAGNRNRYIFQRINHNVFLEPKLLMENIALVTGHIRRKLMDNGLDDINRRTLTLVPTAEDTNFCIDKDGNYWRVYLFIEDAATYDKPETPRQAREAARAFGLFQKQLLDINVSKLNETIPDFHNTRRRFSDLQSAIESDPCNRAAEVKNEIDDTLKREHMVDTLLTLNINGTIPTRTTHNDTKLNNVMLDNRSQSGLCVIDLDTVMPGLSLYDFGDIVRSSTTLTSEDEKDLSLIHVDMNLFNAVTDGYLSSARDLLTDMEIELMPFSAKLISLEIGIRFLTDYLLGDKYFKIHRAGQNIDRCRAQFQKVKSMEQNEEKMAAIVASHR